MAVSLFGDENCLCSCIPKYIHTSQCILSLPPSVQNNIAGLNQLMLDISFQNIKGLILWKVRFIFFLIIKQASVKVCQNAHSPQWGLKLCDITNRTESSFTVSENGLCAFLRGLSVLILSQYLYDT